MKILIIYATAGAGHRRAAEALAQEFEKTDHQVTLVDCLDYTSSLYKVSYSKGYTFLVSKIPWLWAFAFGLLDLPFMSPVMRFSRRLQNIFNTKKLENYLIEEKFDYIFSTHFLTNEVAGYLKIKGKIGSHIVSIVTDFDVHRIWLAKGVDTYCVASDWTKKKLAILDIPDENIVVTGIPTDEKFTRHDDIAALKRKLGLDDDLFTVLIATGSFGFGPIEKIIQLLPGMQIIVVCGHNKALYERLSKKPKDLVKVCGLVNNMDELMAVSDAMITKPGGLSISEALVSGLPMIFFNAIPGQETNNIKVLKEYGIGISNCPIEEMAKVLNGLRISEEDLQEAKENIKKLAQPDAAGNIVNLVSGG